MAHSLKDLKNLYTEDFNRWRETIIQTVRERQFQDVDWENLITELEDMGKSDRRTFVSNLTVLIAHLLKLTVQAGVPESMKSSWYNSVDEHRDRIQQDFLENPSFKNYLASAIAEAYPRARKLAIKEGNRAAFGIRKPKESDYPSECPFNLEQFLDENFYG
jgi:DNA-binding helix-hairpin-helix protein with protein kinase domain